MAEIYSARRPFGYGDGTLDPGQLVELIGSRNDEKLVRLGYLEKADGRKAPFNCRVCGVPFVDEGTRDRHGNKAHPSRALSAEDQDRALDREMKQLEQVAPLYLDKTAESRGVRRGRRA